MSGSTSQHTTLAGARLDPNVNYESTSSSATTEPAGVTGSTTGDLTGATGETAGSNKGIGATVLSYIGLGGSGGSTDEGVRNVKEYETEPPVSSAGTTTGTGIGTGTQTSSLESAGAHDLNAGRDLNTGTSSTALGSGVDATGTKAYESPRESVTASATDTSAPSTTDALGAGVTSTSRSSNTATEHSPQDTRKVREVTEAPGASDTEPKARSSEPGLGGDKPSATRENPSAIPTAGDEKLGTKHWGESKIVPDNPQPAGLVSSEDGQPDQSTAANTSRNTGSASGPPGSHSQAESEGKEKLTDKIKNKLHMGSH